MKTPMETFRKFQSRNRDAFHFRLRMCTTNAVLTRVSISSSRGFSFQDDRRQRRERLWSRVSISSSRGFSFQGRLPLSPAGGTHCPFQSRHRDAFHFRPHQIWSAGTFSVMFQSRHRDAFHFRYRDPKRCLLSFQKVSISSSRCFSFQGRTRRTLRYPVKVSIS